MTGWGDAAFAPGRVALVGASRVQGKLGRVLLENLRGYRGELVAVHPDEREILGVAAFPNLRAVRRPVDLAVITTPPRTVPGILEDCAAAAVRVAVVLSGGFAETGREGAALQARTLAAARAGGVRLVGPNCFGLIDAHRGLNASMGLGLPAPGGVSLYTQSGAYGMLACSRSRDGGIGFAKVLAAGNGADIDAAEALRFLADDPETTVIALFLESIRDGRALLAAAGAATRHKPVVAAVVGRQSAGRRAAASHTAALTGDAMVAVAVLRQAGVHVVEEGRILFDVAAALERQGPLLGRRVAIITNSGGTGVELADALEEEHLEVPPLSDPLERQIAAGLPAHASANNPVDVTTDWERFPDMYAHGLRSLVDSGEVNAVVAVLLQRAALSAATCDAVIAGARRGLPVHVLWVAPEEAAENRRRLLGAGIPCHESAALAARVLARCRARTIHDQVRAGPPLPRPQEVDGDGWVAAGPLFELLAEQGLPLARYRVVDKLADVRAAAAHLHPPLVVKALRPGVVHKRAAGAVWLALAGPDEAHAAARLLGAGPYLVQEQAALGLELLIGAKHDARFGPIVVVGLGGIFAEALADVAVRAAPIDRAEAARAWSELRAAAILDQAGVDRAALVALTVRVAQFVARAPWCAELDLNPVIAGPARLVIVDARLRVGKE